MKDILQAIQSTLQGSPTLSYVGDSVIVVEIQNDTVPAHGAFPMITLNDGGAEREREWVGNSSGFLSKEKVLINLWQVLLEDDKSLVGSGSTKGVLDLEADVNTILHCNTLSLASVLDAYCEESGESQMVVLGDLAVVRKTLNYTYLKLEVK